MNTLGILGSLLLVLVKFTWTAPDPADGVTKVQISVTATKGDYTQAQIIDAGLPVTDAAGKQSFSTNVDLSSTKWAVIQGVNSFGTSDPGAELRLGKPGKLSNPNASPG